MLNKIIQTQNNKHCVFSLIYETFNVYAYIHIHVYAYICIYVGVSLVIDVEPRKGR